MEWAENIKLQVYNASLLMYGLLLKVYVSLPDPRQTWQAPLTPESYWFPSSKDSS